MRFELVVLLTALVLAWSMWRGGAPERAFAGTLIVLVIADPIYHAIFGPPIFDRVDAGHGVIDTVGLAIFFLIGLKANRIWPLMACSLQIIACLGHIVRYMELSGALGAYWAMTQVTFIGHLIILTCGTYLHIRRQRRGCMLMDWRGY